MSKEIKRLKKELYRLGVSFLKNGREEEFKEYGKKRKELITKEVEKLNYHIAEDLRLIAEDFKEKYPGVASDAKKFSDVYLAEAKGRKMNTLPTTLKEYELRKFKIDLEKCLNNVLSDFPEFLDSRFRIIFEPVPSGNWSIMSISRSIGNNYHISFDSLALYCLFDDDRKEGGLAHELSEALHLKNNNRKAITRALRWYNTNKRNYKILSQKHADLDAARRGYGLKLIEALEPYKSLESEVSVEESEIRIKNLEDYLRK